MKYKCSNLKYFTSLFLVLTISIPMVLSTTYLKLDIVEAVNLHCKLNDEFYCNPYAEIEFKYSTEKRTSKRIECTKNPKWESGFSFEPSECQDHVYINFYQYLTPKDKAYLGEAVSMQEHYEKGEISPGYLGRVTLHLDKLPFGYIDDWFMIESPIENERIKFPSCVHLRVYFTSTSCTESSESSIYQLDSLKNSENLNSPNLIKKFEPKNYIPMCKKDFAMIYKTKFSRMDKEEQIHPVSELDMIEEKDRKANHCKRDSSEDYGFLHKFSNLTSIEEALVYKIIKRTTGETINYEEFTNSYKNRNSQYIKSYREFFEKECFKKPEMTIERINKVLKNDAEKFPNNTSNPYINPNENLMDYPLIINHKNIKNIYNDTLDQFYAMEDVKNLDSMDEDSYIQSVNKMAQVLHEIKAEKKTDATLFYMKNKVMLTNEGRVDPREERFFRIYALYKWNGGKFEYDEIKREYMLRKKYFYCYEIVKVMPTNIIFQFIEDVCPDNYICVDPNGIVINSKGKNPRKVFKTEIEKNGINFFSNTKNKQMFQNDGASNNLRFKSITGLARSSSNSIKKLEKKDSPSKLDENTTEEKNLNSDVTDFSQLLKMEENTSDLSMSHEAFSTEEDEVFMNKFDQLYIQRKTRIKKKKEIIINKVFNFVPLLGESLALANLEVLRNKINTPLISRESNLFKKYLLLYNSNIPFVEKASQMLVNLILCNSDKNKLRYLLNEMIEGLCFGDDRSVKIFMEIIRTVILDSLLEKPYYLYNDLHSKVNLVRTLNKPFCYKTITKIRFIESMLMLDAVKERITYIIWNNDTNKKIENKIQDTEISIPITLNKNKRLFAYNTERDFDNSNDINKNYLDEMKRIEKFNQQHLRFRFKSHGEKNRRNIGLSKITEETIENTKFNEDELLGRIENYKKLLDEEVIEKNDNNLLKNKKADQDLMHEFSGFFDQMHFKEREKLNKTLSIDPNKKEEKMSLYNIEKFSMKKLSNTKKNNFKSKIKNNSTLPHLIYDQINIPKFKSIESQFELFDTKPNSDYFNQNLESSDEFATISLNQYNNPHIYQQHEIKGASVLYTENSQSSNHNSSPPSNEEILSKLMKDPATRKMIEEVKMKSISDPKNKILYPKEIHSTFEVNKRGTKQITVNQNNPTKKLILDKLMDESSFNDMMNQEEKNQVDDQTGLFNVLKNIQNKKCSCGFLCIEIGTVYGPFDNLRPKNVTVLTNHRENVQVIIKPVIIVNSTVEAPQAPIKPEQPDISNLFDEEDCDILKMSSISSGSTNIYNRNMRFKQLVDKHSKVLKLKRKFYRKVEFGNEILATEIFKQGLNVIILSRTKGYTKLFERTFNTNHDAIESDAMACVLRDAGYDKIIVITGVGKWMGSITPRLVKEIKQIGGPDLNRFVSVDSQDNSMMDHAFILIGRRGLCRYNGIFRVKNYDISKDLKIYFPDIASDPNDCYFENLAFENEKNKHSENQFFHLVDLRLNLNLDNDNRFSYKAPVISSVSPNAGPLNGGSWITVRGKNFGSSTLDIKEVLVRGVVCKDIVFVNSNVIRCFTGSSMIMGPGTGNIQIKLLCGLSSPVNTCNMWEYTKEIREEIEEKPLPIIKPSTNVVNIHVLPPPPACFHRPMISKDMGPPEIILPNLFSFKEMNKNKNLKSKFNLKISDRPDLNDIMQNLNKKLYKEPNDSSMINVHKVDNLVTENFNHMMHNVSSNGFNPSSHSDGFRKRRFSNLIQQLK